MILPQHVDRQIDILRWFFKRLNQLNISMQGKDKICLDVSKTLPYLKEQYSCGSTELKVEK